MKDYRKRLIDRLDKIVSLYVRTKYLKNGLIQCYTCTTIKPLKEMDCGHYIKRGNMNTRWDLDNLRPQCTACNRFKDGLQDEFVARLSIEFGRDMGIELNKKKHTIKQWTIKELEDMEIKFKKMYDKL